MWFVVVQVVSATWDFLNLVMIVFRRRNADVRTTEGTSRYELLG